MAPASTQAWVTLTLDLQLLRDELSTLLAAVDRAASAGTFRVGDTVEFDSDDPSVTGEVVRADSGCVRVMWEDRCWSDETPDEIRRRAS